MRMMETAMELTMFFYEHDDHSGAEEVTKKGPIKGDVFPKSSRRAESEYVRN